MGEPFQRLTIDEAQGVTRVRFVGEKTDGHAVRELYEAAVSLLDVPPARLLVDLEGVELLTSGGMGMLVSIHKKFVQHGGQMHVTAPDPLVRQSLELTNLHRLLRVFPEAGAAREAFR